MPLISLGLSFPIRRKFTSNQVIPEVPFNFESVCMCINWKEH